MKIRLYDFHARVSLNRGSGVYCECGNHLYEVSNGLLDVLWICEKCHSIYQLELRRVRKKYLTKEYMEQSIKELNKQLPKYNK